MLQNVRVTAFTVSELLRENQQGGGGDKITSPPHTTRPDLGWYFHFGIYFLLEL